MAHTDRVVLSKIFDEAREDARVANFCSDVEAGAGDGHTMWEVATLVIPFDSKDCTAVSWILGIARLPVPRGSCKLTYSARKLFCL